MVTLLGDVHFWSFRDDVLVKDADVGAYRYQEKGPVQKERLYYTERKNYIESRLGVIVPKNTRPVKLRDSLKELDDILTKEKLISEEWISSTIIQLIFGSGLLVFLTIDVTTGDVTNAVLDRYLQGKLLSENVVSATYCSRCILFTYNESKATLVNLGKHFTNKSLKSTVRLSSLDLKLHQCHGIGPAGRRFERQLSVSPKEDLVLIWWQTTEDEVYPWSPLDKEKDRANIFVYELTPNSLKLLHYCRSEMAPLSVKFSRHNPNTILTVEQGFDQKGGVTVLNCAYQVKSSSLVKVSTTAIPLEAPLAAQGHNPQETALLMACNNGVLALHSESKGMTHLTKAGLIPSDITWLNSGTLLLVSNDRGQIQCFDMALSLVRLHLLLEDYNPMRILDLSDYFCQKQYLSRMTWAPDDTFGQLPCIPPVLLHFTQGPLAILRFGTAFCDIEPNQVFQLKQEHLVNQFVKHHQFDEAINLLVSMNWETEGTIAMKCLSRIASAVLKLPLNSQREGHLETALASFFVPSVPFNEQIQDEFSPMVRALTRRFFFKVLRKGLVEKAYRLALDLKDYDCFLNVHHVARCTGEKQIATLSLDNARDIESGSCYSDCSSICSSHSCSSHSQFCSTCSSEENSLVDTEEKNIGKDGMENLSVEPVVINVSEGGLKTAPAKPPPKPSRQAHSLRKVKDDTGDAVESKPFYCDEDSLRRQYEQVIFHEVTTEEEDGGTVKVVHFGVV